jgi:hypothetical protein
VTEVRLPYVRRKRGLLFWQPTPKMQALGFKPMPLGPESADSLARARQLYEQWEKARVARPKVTDYPPGSLGAFYDRMTGRYTKAPTLNWRRMKPRSREDYARAWTHLGPAFGHKVLTRISGEDVERFLDDGEGCGPENGLVHRVSDNERYRTMKVLRALFDDAIVRLRLDQPNPAKIVPNPQARGRSAIWLGEEVRQLVDGAIALGLYGTAVSIAIAWDSLFSPVDIWTLPFKALKQDRAGWYVERARTKTDKGAFGALSAETAMLLGLYVAGLPFELLPESQVIRQRRGFQPYISKDTFGDHFRLVREHVFPGDSRQFLDLRRSGTVEADAAGADKAAMGEILANGLADNRFLQDTYTPPTVAKARLIASQRLQGRERLAAELGRVSARSKA